MHIRALNEQSLWSNQTISFNAQTALSAYASTATTAAAPSGPAPFSGGSLFSNLISTILQAQRSLTGSSDAAGQTAENLEGFLQSLLQQLVPGQTASFGGTASIAGRTGQSSLEGRLESMIAGLGRGASGSQLAGLSSTFNQLMNGLGSGGTAAVSTQSSSLTLQSVLRGMLLNVREQGSSATALGQLVNTYA